MSKKLVARFYHYPEYDDGKALLLAEGIIAGIFPGYVVVFFDTATIETNAGYNKIENISEMQHISICSLKDLEKESDLWPNFQTAKVVARTGLRRKDGKKIKWH